MKKLMSSIIFVFVTICLLGCNNSNSVTNYSNRKVESVYENWKYINNNDKILLQGLVNNKKTLDFPKEIDNISVEDITNLHFWDSYKPSTIILNERIKNADLTVVNVGDVAELSIHSDINALLLDEEKFLTLETINLYSDENGELIKTINFSRFPKLKYVNIYGFVKEIPDEYFSNCCTLEKVKIASSFYDVKKIGNKAFYNDKNLQFVDNISNVTTIGDFAFANTQLTQLNFGKNIQKIGEGTFAFCEKLQDVYFEKLPDYIGKDAFKFNNKRYNKTVNNQQFLVFSDGEILVDYDISDNIFSIPEDIKIITNCFYNDNKIQSVTLPSSLQYIVDNAFENCSQLITVFSKSKDYKIGNALFKNCVMLNYVALPESLKSIPDETFYGCIRYENSQLNDNIESIGESSYYNTSIKNIDLKGKISYIGSCAFANCDKLTSVNIGDYVESLEDKTFENCENLQNINITKNVKKIGYNCFYNTQWFNNLKNEFCIVGDNILIKINMQNQNNIKIPDDVKYISNAFANNEDIHEIYLPNSLYGMSSCAFLNCTNLTKIIFNSQIDLYNSNIFSGCTSLTELNLPQNTKEWNDGVIQNLSNIQQVIIPNGVKYLSTNEFQGCSNLKKIVIPDSVEKIDCIFPTNSVIYATENSYAVMYAKQHLLQFVLLDN